MGGIGLRQRRQSRHCGLHQHRRKPVGADGGYDFFGRLFRLVGKGHPEGSNPRPAPCWSRAAPRRRYAFTLRKCFRCQSLDRQKAGRWKQSTSQNSYPIYEGVRVRGRKGQSGLFIPISWRNASRRAVATGSSSGRIRRTGVSGASPNRSSGRRSSRTMVLAILR